MIEEDGVCLTDGAHTFSGDSVVAAVASVIDFEAFNVPVPGVAATTAVACMLRTERVSVGNLTEKAALPTPPELASLRPP